MSVIGDIKDRFKHFKYVHNSTTFNEDEVREYIIEEVPELERCTGSMFTTNTNESLEFVKNEYTRGDKNTIWKHPFGKNGSGDLAIVDENHIPHILEIKQVNKKSNIKLGSFKNDLSNLIMKNKHFLLVDKTHRENRWIDYSDMIKDDIEFTNAVYDIKKLSMDIESKLKVINMSQNLKIKIGHKFDIASDI
jgi:hypothetical protein